MVNIDGDGKERELERQIPNLETPQDFDLLLAGGMSPTKKENVLIVNHRAF